MAAAAVAAAAEVARMCTAVEDDKGSWEAAGGHAAVGLAPLVGWGQVHGCTEAKVLEPGKPVPVVPRPASPPPRPPLPQAGAEGRGAVGTRANECGKDGVSLVRPALLIGVPGGMLAPKRDGVAV